MNDKDKEAFNKYICSHDQGILQHSDDTGIDVAERAWQAACEYKQKEVDELLENEETLRNHMNSIGYRKLKKIQAENAKLRECVEFYADKNKSNSIFNPDYQNEEDCDFHEDTQFTHFGKYARQVLKELDNK